MLDQQSDDDPTRADFSSDDLDMLPVTLEDAPFCRSLVELFLDYNSLQTIPSAVCVNLTALRVLSAVGNEIDELPDTIGCMSLLQKLFLQENMLPSIPQQIEQLVCLQELNLVGNRLRSLPSTLGSLRSLKSLILDENLLEFLPPSLSDLHNLEVLEVSENKLIYLPDNIGSVRNLRIFNISNNNLKDQLPESFGELANLIEVDLSYNALKNLPSKCCSQFKLLNFFAERNLIDFLPEWINNLPCVKKLSLRDNELSNEPFDESFGTNNVNLETFDFSGNRITRFPESIGKLKNLKVFSIGSVIDELERRAFQNGNYAKYLPSTFGCLTLLKEAHLDENQLVELPEDFGQLVNLEFLDLGQNRLRSLPDSFCNLRSLRVCQLSKNFIKTLPEDIGQLQSVIDFRIDNNYLLELPDSMKELTQLQSLDLFNNLLTKLPECIPHLTNLIRLDVQDNKFDLEWWEVPTIHKSAKYKPRDPKLAHDWRGRPRVDRVDDLFERFNLDSADAQSSGAINASMNSTSFWKSHTSTATKREKFIHRDSDAEETRSDEEDLWECADITPSPNKCLPPVEESPAIIYSKTPPSDEFEAEENWDLEAKTIRLLDPMGNNKLQSRAINRPTFGIPEEHIFVPGDAHVGSFVLQSKSTPIMATTSQFEDAD